nr:hypothetical protein [uncultured Solibaculum sp.]
MGKSSQKKGAAGERELAALLHKAGYSTKRGAIPYGGSSDVEGLPGIHIECKRVEKLNVLAAYQQAMRDAKEGEIPVLFHRRNRSPWLVTMGFDDWIALYKKAYQGNKPTA